MKKLYRKLTRDDVACFFDRQDISWGDNWVTTLEQGLNDCDTLVLILSPGFCNSEWAILERTSVMAEDLAGLKSKIRPLLLEPCADLIPRFLKPIQFIDVCTDAKFEAEYPKICEALGGTSGLDAEKVDRNS